MQQSNTTPLLECYMLDTGYCVASEHHIMRGGAHREIHCHALVALLRHPVYGWLLWDTGYAPRMLEATRAFPFSLYRRATPLHIQPELSVAAQLARWQLQPSAIQHVFVSHFHADHIAGLLDFPEATFVATRSAYADVVARQGFAALRRAFIPSLLPADFTQRVQFISHFDGPTLPGLGATHDFFADGSLLLMPLPGHARGQMGVLAATTRGPILLAADGSWMRQAIRERRAPSRVTALFTDDFAAVRRTLENLHTFSGARPDVTIIPTHCPEAFAQEVEASYAYH